jgi:hypothetical protein
VQVKNLQSELRFLNIEVKNFAQHLLRRKKIEKRQKIDLFNKKQPEETQFFFSARIAAVQERAKEIKAKNECKKTFREEKCLQQALACK